MKKKFLVTALGIASVLGLLSPANAINLEQSYQLALTHDLQYVKAGAELQQAIGTANLNYANFLPQIALKYQASSARNSSYPKQFGTLNNSQLSIVLQQNILNFVDFLKLDIAEKQKVQAQVTYLSEKQQLISRVINGYLEVLKANSNYQISVSQVNYLSDLVKDTNAKFKKGLVSQVDLDQIQAKLEGARAQAVGNQALLEKALNDFQVIVGPQADLSSFDGIGDKIPNLTYATKLNLNAISNNLTLKSLAMSREIASVGTKASKAALLPNVTFQASYGNNPKNTILPGDDGWKHAHKFDTLYLGVTVTIPIFTGGQIYNGIKIANALYNQATTGYQLAYQKTQAALKSNAIAIKANKSIITSYEVGVKAARKASKSRRAAYRFGVASITEVFDTSNQLFSLEQQLVSAKYNYLSAIVTQKLLLGTLSEKDLETLSQGFNVKQVIKQ